MRALVVVALLALLVGTAAAEPPRVPAHDRPHEDLLGFRIDFGSEPVRGRELRNAGLTVAAERRIRGPWRAFGEYTYLWLTGEDVTGYDGSGHRLQAGLRVTLAESRRLGRILRFYADAELGGGAFLGDEPQVGSFARPHAFAGLRAGYDFKMRRATTTSIIWQPELLVRALATPDGLGVVFGVGMGWGD